MGTIYVEIVWEMELGDISNQSGHMFEVWIPVICRNGYDLLVLGRSPYESSTRALPDCSKELWQSELVVYLVLFSTVETTIAIVSHTYGGSLVTVAFLTNCLSVRGTGDGRVCHQVQQSWSLVEFVGSKHIMNAFRLCLPTPWLDTAACTYYVVR